jgi:AcrR family transcriptional regulator
MKRLDRRVARSQRRLKDALLSLIDERDYDAITVADITRRADVGRSTFYVHFNSKEDLLFDGFERALLALAEHDSARGSRPGFRFSLPLLRHIGTQRRFALATMVHGANARIRKQTIAIFANVVRHELARASARRATGDARLLDAQVHAVAGAFLGLVSWWLTEGSRVAPEAVDQMFQRWW